MLEYRSSKHEITDFTSAELFLGRELRLPLDLLHGRPPNLSNVSSDSGYFHNLKERMSLIHETVRQRLKLKSLRSKAIYDQKDRRLSFEPKQKV